VICVSGKENGSASNEKTVIEFANSISLKTEYQVKVEAAKMLRGLDGEDKLGVRWYQGFLSCHTSLLTRSGTVIRDCKRST
jgi:hypothetical protein